jgi:hypothetical protein
LTGAEPRGLPGTTIDSVKLQRAAEGYPLDDVIVLAHESRGGSAVLEIQVKRSITFTPSDPVFRAVVTQIAQAARLPDFWTVALIFNRLRVPRRRLTERSKGRTH